MAFDPGDFFTLAESLAAQDHSESRLRTAVGRVYYAAFLRARDQFHVTGRRRVHRNVITALKRFDRAAGDQLDKLEDLRGYADYETNISDPLYSDWDDNWHKARAFAIHILGRLP